MSSPQDDDTKKSPNMLSFEHWRQKAAWITGLGLSPEDVIKRDEIAQLRRDEHNWKWCEKKKAELLRNSACFAVLLSKLEDF
jgi:mitochondrial inner membrane protease ATP23